MKVSIEQVIALASVAFPDYEDYPLRNTRKRDYDVAVIEVARLYTGESPAYIANHLGRSKDVYYDYRHKIDVWLAKKLQAVVKSVHPDAIVWDL